MPDELGEFAYEDTPLPIEEGQTISQPYIVARMIAAIEPRPDARVLEIGTGSGYAAAVLSRVVGRVLHGGAARGARRPGAPSVADARIRQCRGASWRREPRLAGARPVRCDHRDRGRAARAAAAPRSARRRRAHGDSDRRRPASSAARPGDSRHAGWVRRGAIWGPSASCRSWARTHGGSPGSFRWAPHRAGAADRLRRRPSFARRPSRSPRSTTWTSAPCSIGSVPRGSSCSARRATGPPSSTRCEPGSRAS